MTYPTREDIAKPIRRKAKKSVQQAAKNKADVWDLKFDPGPDPGLDDLMDAPFDLSKEGQLARSPGGNRKCPSTGELKATCKCRPCIGRRSRGKGKRKQNDARKAIEKGFGRSAGRTSAITANEENWQFHFRFEVKAGAMAKTVDTFYRNTRAQSDAQKAIGNIKPFVGVAMPDGSSDGYLVIRLSDLPTLSQALREEL